MTTVVVGVVAGVVLAAGALVPLLWRGPGLRAARARARSAHARLGHLLATVAVDPDPADPDPVDPDPVDPDTVDPDPVDPDPVDPDTVRRAQERWTTTGALLARAATAEDLALAERTAAEGIGLLTGP